MSQAQEMSDLFDFIGRTIFRTTLLIACSYVGASLAGAEVIQAFVYAPLQTQQQAPPSVPRNLVIEPEYSPVVVKEENTPPAAEKVQFEPVNRDLPLFHEKLRSGEFNSGALYPPGMDTVVDPGSNITVIDESVMENKIPETVKEEGTQSL
jgi:hypothetical protein